MAEINQGQANNKEAVDVDTPTPVASHTAGHFPEDGDSGNGAGDGDGAGAGDGDGEGSAPTSRLTDAMRRQTPDGVKIFLEGKEFRESW